MYNPALGPPTYPDTASTLEEFEVQKEAFLRYSVGVGMLQESSPGTFTNTIPFNNNVTPQRVRDLVETVREFLPDYKIPTTPAGIPDLGVPEVAASSRSCPPGQEPVATASGGFICLDQSGAPAINLPTGAPMALPSQFLAFNANRINAGMVSYAPSSGITGSAIDWGGVAQGAVGVAGAGCAGIGNAALRAACEAAVLGAGAILSRGATGGASDPRGAGLGNTPACPAGFTWNGTQCVVAGVSGTLQRTLPFGQTGLLNAGQSMGGAGGVAPASYAQPTLRCPRRYVLGLDNICYPKGMIPRAYRKWVPGRKPLLSANDGKILTRAKSLEKKLRKVSSKYVRRPKSCGPPKRRGK